MQVAAAKSSEPWIPGPAVDFSKKLDEVRKSRTSSLTQRLGFDHQVPVSSPPVPPAEERATTPASSTASPTKEVEVDYVSQALVSRRPEELLAASERAQSDGRILDAAECLTSFLRIKTDGNLLRVVGDVDPAEYKALWEKHAPVASQLSADAAAKDSKCIKSRALFAEARTMQAAAKGIVKVATSGELPVLQKAVKDLRAMNDAYDLGVAWVFAGSNYLALPWPLASAKKAKERFAEALRVRGDSCRNLYFAALAERALGNHAEALSLFEKAAGEAANPKSDSERDVAAFIKEQALAGAAEARSKA